MAVYEAAALLKRWDGEYRALQEAMRKGASIVDCVQAVEGTS